MPAGKRFLWHLLEICIVTKKHITMVKKPRAPQSREKTAKFFLRSPPLSSHRRQMCAIRKCCLIFAFQKKSRKRRKAPEQIDRTIFIRHSPNTETRPVPPSNKQKKRKEKKELEVFRVSIWISHRQSIHKHPYPGKRRRTTVAEVP